MYRSEKTAKYAKGSFSLFHDDCDCQIVPEWDRDQAHIEGYDPDRMYSEYMHARSLIENGGLDDDTYRMIKATTKGNPDNPNDPNTLVYLMRRLYPDRYKDGYGVPRPSRSH